MAAASVRIGTPVEPARRNRARRPSREMKRPRITWARGPKKSSSARVRLPATVPGPVASRRATAWRSTRAVRSRTRSARKASKSLKWRCRTPLAQPGLGGHHEAGQTAQTVPEHYPFGGVKQLLAGVGAAPLPWAFAPLLCAPPDGSDWMSGRMPVYSGHMPTITPEPAPFSRQRVS